MSAHAHDQDAVDAELEAVVRLLEQDAARIEQMPGAREVRLRVLEGIAEHPRHVAAPRRGRGVRRHAAGVRRVALVAGVILVMCTSAAVADTKTPVGKAVRMAARSVNIPVPPEPGHRPHHRPPPRDEVGDGERPGEHGGRPGQPGSDDVSGPDADPGLDGDGVRGDSDRLPGDDPMLGQGDRLPPPDGQEPKPPLGDAPPPDGQQPKPPLDQLPPPDGQQPKPPHGQNPPPGGQQGGQQPKPPLGQQPKPPLGQNPPPGGQQPGGQQPQQPAG